VVLIQYSLYQSSSSPDSFSKILKKSLGVGCLNIQVLKYLFSAILKGFLPMIYSSCFKKTAIQTAGKLSGQIFRAYKLVKDMPYENVKTGVKGKSPKDVISVEFIPFYQSWLIGFLRFLSA